MLSSEEITRLRHNLSRYEKEKIVIYGTGEIAADIIEALNDYNVVGVMDSKKYKGRFCNKLIVSPINLFELNVKVILIAASTKNTQYIYFRLQYLTEKLGITICSKLGKRLDGDSYYDYMLSQDEKNINKSLCDSKHEALLKQMIDDNDYISFDLFDTLITRKLKRPHDLFLLLEEQINYTDIKFPFICYERICSEIELDKKYPNINEIYDRFKERTGLSEEDVNSIMNKELELEKKYLIARNKMVELLNYASDKGKKIYIISDMYLPSKMLKSLLVDMNIKRYDHLMVSCDYRAGKTDYLFNIYMDSLGLGKYLHIGDHPIADYKKPIDIKMNAFLVLKPIDMFRTYLDNMNVNITHIMGNEKELGYFIAQVFNSPFIDMRNTEKLDKLINEYFRNNL